MRPIAIILLSTLLLSAACTRHGQTRAALDRADSLMTEHPDSALTILQAINGHALPQGSELQARYALLLTQAEVKSHISVTDDSLISLAVNFYTDNGDPNARMLSYYYQGRIEYNREDYAKSIVSMFYAYAIAQELNNKFWAAMSTREISAIYNQTYNHAEELKYAQIAYDNFKLINRQPHLSYAADLSAAHLNMNDREHGEKTLHSLIDSAKGNHNQELLTELYRQLGRLYLKCDNYDKAREAWEIVCTSPQADGEDSVFLGTAYAGLGFIDSANNIRNMYVKKGMTPAKQFLIYTILKHSGKYEDALLAGEQLDNMTDSVFRSKINLGITNAVASYFDQTNRIIKANHDRATYRLWMFIAISLLVLLIIIWWFNWYYQLQKNTIKQYVDSLNKLKESLTITEKKASKAHTVASELISNHFREFDTIFSESFEMDGNPQRQKRASNKVKALIKIFSSDENKLSDLEELADKHYNQAMSEIRQDFPDLKKEELRLFLYSILGFSIKTQGILLDKHSMAAIYSARRHFTEKLRKQNASKAEKYIDLLNRQKT